MSSWEFARTIWDRHAQPLRDLGLTLDRVDETTYWQTFDTMRAEHFPPEVFFRLSNVRTEAGREGMKRVAETRGGEPLRDFHIARRDGEIAALFSGHSRDPYDRDPGAYRMWHTAVHSAHRRRGIYRAIVTATIGYTHELGFDAIVSEHAPCNNPILIAKMSAGFRIVSLELDAAVGPTIVLRYFHHPDHLAAYELRCGHASLTPALKAVGFGAYDRMRAQFEEP